MWAEIAISGGFVGTQIVILSWINARVNRVEKDRRKELYQPNGQTNYMTRNECDGVKEAFCGKVEEIKELIVGLSNKLEKEKDAHHEEQTAIAVRLTAIEGKLP